MWLWILVCKYLFETLLLILLIRISEWNCWIGWSCCFHLREKLSQWLFHLPQELHHFPTSNALGFQFLHILANISFPLFCFCFNRSRPDGFEVVSPHGFDLHFCNDWWCMFSGAYWASVNRLWGSVYSSPLNCVYCCCCCCKSFQGFWIASSYRIHDLQIFTPICGSFHITCPLFLPALLKLIRNLWRGALRLYEDPLPHPSLHHHLLMVLSWFSGYYFWAPTVPRLLPGASHLRCPHIIQEETEPQGETAARGHTAKER